MLRLRVTAGPGGPTEVPITGDRFVIGRDLGAGLSITDDEASSEHATLSPLPDGRVALEDLGSTNGTFVNGHRMTGPVSLSGGEEIRIGSTTMTLFDPDATIATTSAAAAASPVAAAPAVVATPSVPNLPGPAPASSGDRAGGPARVGAGLLSLFLAFGAAVMIIVAIEAADLNVCSDTAALEREQATTGAFIVECYDGSTTEKSMTVVLGWLSGIIAALGTVLAFLFTIRGRGGRPVVITAAAAVLLALIVIVFF